MPLAGGLRLSDHPASEVTIPLSLKQILGARIAELSEGALRLAGLLAVAVFMYIALDGFDLGLGILFPFAATDEDPSPSRVS